MSMPEDRPVRAVLQKTLLAIVSELPGGGVLSTVIQATVDAASRQRDEDWWAMLGARVTSLEVEVQAQVRFDDPEFVAAAHRIVRAAQETADETKRDRLAAALAHGGSWAALPADERERMERLIIELTSREVWMLGILADPKAWVLKADPQAAEVYSGNLEGTFEEFLHGVVCKGDESATAAGKKAIESLQMRGLAGLSIRDRVPAERILQPKATPLGRELIDYLSVINA